jgi:hypothetical protein
MKDVIATGQKVVVFTCFKEGITRHKKAWGDAAVTITGADSADRQDAVDRFQDDPAVRIALWPGGLLDRLHPAITRARWRHRHTRERPADAGTPAAFGPPFGPLCELVGGDTPALRSVWTLSGHVLGVGATNPVSDF